jgi:hypothetical protein
MEHATDVVKDDKHFVLQAVHYSGEAIHWASERLKEDSQVIITAVAHDPFGSYCTESTSFDEAFAFVSNYIDDDGTSTALEFVSESLRSNRTIVLAAVTTDPMNYLAATVEQKRDPEIILKVLQTIFSCSQDEHVSPSAYMSDMDYFFPGIMNRLMHMYETVLVEKCDTGSDQHDSNIHYSHDLSHPTKSDRQLMTKQRISPDAWYRSQWERIWLLSRIVNGGDGEKIRPMNMIDWSEIQQHIVSYIGPHEISIRYKMITRCWPVLRIVGESNIKPRRLQSDHGTSLS